LCCRSLGDFKYLGRALRPTPQAICGTGILPVVLIPVALRHDRQDGHGNAVSLPQNNHEHDLRDVTIARLIVGIRHCRVLTVGNIKSVGIRIIHLSFF